MYIKEYTVEELSTLLMVNKETVRRWVRDGKLAANNRNSKKEGYVINELHLQQFITDNPKYDRIRALKSAPEYSDFDTIETKRKIYSAGKTILQIKDLMAELECILSELYSM